MRPIDEKVQAFSAAKELLAQGEEKVLRYAALELRRCIEAVVYEKLEAYQKWISEKIARTWRPPQAFRALLEIDPGGQDDAVFAVAAQDRPDEIPRTPLKVIGTDRRPSIKWLTETWNKLGSHLHADWPYSRKRVGTDRREFYDGVLSELEPFVATHFAAAMTNTIEFKCSECGQPVVISEKGLAFAGHATCLNCSLRYSHREQDGAPYFLLEEPVIECDGCHQPIYVPSAELRDGYEFQCRKCKVRFRAIARTWGVQRLIETASAPRCQNGMEGAGSSALQQDNPD